VAQQPATTPIPVQLSATEFTACILPHLSMPKRGPQGKLGYQCVFHLIVWVLYTGMQWKCLPVPKDLNVTLPSTTRPSPKSLRNRPMMGRSGRRLWPVYGSSRKPRNSTCACCMATGPPPGPKKGGWHGGLRRQTPAGREGHCHHRPSWLCVSSPPRGSRQ